MTESDPLTDGTGAEAPVSAQFSADVSDEWSWAAAHARIPQILDLVVTVSHPLPQARVTVTLAEDDRVIGTTVVHDGQFAPGSTGFRRVHVPLSAAYMGAVDERRPAVCTLRLLVPEPSGDGHRTLAEAAYQVDLQPRDLWLFMGDPRLVHRLAEAADDSRTTEHVRHLAGVARSLLASFVRPNNPVIATIAREAARIKEKKTGDAGFSAFQTADPQAAARAVEDIVSAAYEAIQSRRIAYSEPPPGWDYTGQGQRIREHDRVAAGGLATCMDTTVLLAAVLEHVGLHPTLMLIKGHIFVGYWLRDPFASRRLPEWYPDAPVVWDREKIGALIDRHFLGVIETTTMAGSAVDAELARQVAHDHVEPLVLSDDGLFHLIDVAAARRAGVSPLPAVRHREDGAVEVVEYRPGHAPDVTVLQPEGEGDAARHRLVDSHPPRYRSWKGALLTLDATSALLNLGTGPAAQPIVLPPEGLGILEDRLHQDVEFELLSGFDLPDVVRARGTVNAVRLDPAEQLDFLHQRKLFIQRVSHTRSSDGPVPPAKLLAELRAMARRAKEGREERGMNPLFLTIGLLRWPYTSASKGSTTAEAPIILVPVTINLKARSRYVTLSLDTTSQVAPNHALIEWLRREHGLHIPELAEPQADKAGLDVEHVLAAVRTAVAGAGLDLEVASEARLALLDLAAFRMWRDLNEHADVFLQNPLVRHLVHTPTEPYVDQVPAKDDDLEMVDAPVPADAAQLTAVAMAGQGRTFVLQGPPGTGKSQTITNLLAHCVSKGMRLLFVAEKQTALAVVQRRLHAIGLEPFTLNLHHEGSSAAEVRAKLKASLTTRVQPDPTALETAHRRLRSHRFQLAHYPEVLHSPNAAGLSAYTAHDRMLVLGEGREVTVPPSLVARNGAAVQAIDEILRGVPAWAIEAGLRPHHPWRLAGPRTSPLDLDAASRAVRDVLDAVERTRPIRGPVREALDAAATSDDLRALAAGADPRLPRGRALEQVLQPAWPERTRALLEQCEQSLAGWRPRLRALTPEVLRLDLERIRAEVAAAAGGNIFSRKSRRSTALAPLASLAPPGYSLEGAAAEQLIDELRQLQDVDRRVRAAIADVPGLQLPPDFTPFAPDGLAPIRSRVDTLLEATGPLRAGDPSTARLRGLAVTGEPVAHRDVLVPLDRAWRSLLEALAVRPADLDVWREGEGLLAAIDRHAAAWREHVSYERLLPLQRWASLVSRLAPIEQAGLQAFRDDLLDLRLPLHEAEEAFARGVAHASLEERVRATGLDHFDSVAHDANVKGFAAAQAEVRHQWATAGPAELLRARGASGGAFSGAATGGLARELEKTRGRLGTRALLRKHGAAVQTLTPIVLTSPASAVDLIEPGVMNFDLVVFDEASQIAVPEAIGAIGRAQAVVVVGDSKQMPPTRRVGSVAGREEEIEDPDAEEVVEDQESILSECELARIPTVQLSWHYRSQDEALIAFSNRAYYKGELSSFPTPTLLSSETGVEFRKVDGRYRRSSKDHAASPVSLGVDVTAGPNTNPEEALAIAAAVVELIDRSADGRPSLGVVTFNEQQRVLIEDLLRASPDLRVATLLDEHVMGPTDVLFVKALEQVQGDERDVILFSVAFSEQANGRIPLNFGRLSNLGGERRLNVAVTRARRKNIVFCSFEPGKLEAEKSSYLGVKDLKRFLEFARSAGSQGDGADLAVDRTPVRDRHRDEIADAVRARGLHVLTDVGLSDFRLDLVLAHPDQPERVILPVLLDGESWRRRETVSDRDVLPVEVLHGLMGWPAVARVWWPMWLQNRQLALDTLMAEFENARAVLDRPGSAENARASDAAGAGSVAAAGAGATPPDVAAATRAAPTTPPPERPAAGPPQPPAPAAAGTPQPPAAAPPQPRDAVRSPLDQEPLPLDEERAPAERYPAAPATTWRHVPPPPADDQPAESTRTTAEASPQGLAPYTAWSGSGLKPADQTTVQAIAAVLEEIVRFEGPMHAELAYRRYLAASGGSRLGSAIKRTFNQAATLLVRSGRLAQIPDDVAGQMAKTLYAPGTPAVVVREIGDRSLTDVPRSEVRLLVEHLGLDVDDPGVKRAILRAYGRVALTKAADAYLNSCLGYTVPR